MEDNNIKIVKMGEICVCCGQPVPAGIMVCKECENGWSNYNIKTPKEENNMIYRVYDTENRVWERNPNTVIFKNNDIGILTHTKFGKKYKLKTLSNNYIYQQYIGCEDKNGKRIFEGDVLKLKMKDKVIMGVVTYSENECAYILIDYATQIYYPLGKDICSVVRVVGNIFDNKQMIDEDIQKRRDKNEQE